MICEIDCDASSARRVIIRLIDEGLLTVKGPVRLRSKSVSEVKYCVVEDEDVFNRATKKYFDPTLKIEFLVRMLYQSLNSTSNEHCANKE